LLASNDSFVVQQQAHNTKMVSSNPAIEIIVLQYQAMLFFSFKGGVCFFNVFHFFKSFEF
jgi:hypothetical protein